MLLRTGTTTVADIEAVPGILPTAWEATPLRVHSFRELIGIKHSSSAADLVSNAASSLAALPGADHRVGLYRTRPTRLRTNCSTSPRKRRGAVAGA